MLKNICTFFSCCLLAGMASNVTAQSIATIDLEQSKVVVNGGSTLHDWKAEASEFGTNLETLTVSEENEISNLYFFVKVTSLDGGRGATMNKKINNAFDAEKNPLIEFNQEGSLVLETISSGQNVKLIANGTLSMAGVSKKVQLEVEGEKKENGILLKGNKPMKMSDFNIEEPSAMFGQIVCDDDVTINFELFYKIN